MTGCNKLVEGYRTDLAFFEDMLVISVCAVDHPGQGRCPGARSARMESGLQGTLQPVEMETLCIAPCTIAEMS